MNTAPNSERIRISIFGRRNAGKSSLLNAILGQDIATVSAVPGTTTDAVFKPMELLPLGPVLLVDTPGLDDDQAEIGELRIKRTQEELRRADIAIVVTSAKVGLGELEANLIADLRAKGIAFIVAINKLDEEPLTEERAAELERVFAAPIYPVSAKAGQGINELKEALAQLKPEEPQSQHIIGDRLSRGDIAILVVPIDKAAPKGRLILPQQQTIRDLLDCGCNALVCQVHELSHMLSSLSKAPAIVITDSQVFAEVRAIVPQDIKLTSFSILMAQYKGNYELQRRGAEMLDKLNDGDTLLIAEGCTHHRQCNDIGTVKLPNWIKKYTGKNLNFEFTSGQGWKDDLSKYALIIHCGACMLNRREMRNRLSDAEAAGVPITNYGIAIAKLQGVDLYC